MLFLLALLSTLQMHHQALGYNVDDKNPKIFSSEAAAGKSYFGYSVALYANGEDSVLLVGAPRANSSFFPGVFEPGAVYRCSPANGSCSEWLVDISGVKPPNLSRFDRQVKNGSWFGASMDLHVQEDESTEARVAICAPRWKKESLYTPRRSFMNGMCFSSEVISRRSVSRRYYPLSKTVSQTVLINGNNYYDHGMAEAGFSVHWPANSRLQFAIGAPGAAIWSGSSLLLTEKQWDSSTDNFEAMIPDILSDIRFERNDYFGYSITSGQFYAPGEVLYAAGAPRSSRTRGKVFVYQFPGVNNRNRQLMVKDILDGEQYGEYFGSALTACDVNSDGRDDLIIGAPLWSRLSDEGRVYAYVSQQGANGRSSISVQRITGELDESGARFGSALSCIGDLDHDGYADLAVSAPYEDDHRGAIYIFQGRAEGLSERYSQRIRAAELSTSLRGFGQAIARDLQGNLAVGAYLSGHAVVLASRPVLVMSLEVRVSENKYSLLTNQTNLPLEFCSSYDGLYNNAPDVINATFTVQVDKFHHRAIIYEKVAFGDTYRLVDTLTKGQEKCTSIKAYFKKNHGNVIDPIMVKAQVNLTDSSCPNCPVISPQLSKTVDELKLAFLLDCGQDAVCVSDLRVVSVTSPDLPTGRFVIGSKPSVNLSLAIENNGEPAYRAQAHVYVPQPIGLARIPPECNEQAQIINKTLELICNVGNPLRDNYTLLLELDMSAIVYADESQEIQVVLTTQSKEKHFFDNIQTFLISYDVEADITIVGKSYEDSYALFERDITERNYSKNSFDHVYEIQKFGATSIEEAHLTLNVPTHWNDSEIARIRHVQGYMDGRKLDCKNIAKEESDSVLMLPLNRTLFREGNNSVTVSSEARTFYINCTNQAVVCQTFLCALGPFVKKNSVAKVTVSMDLELSNNTVEEMKGKDVLLFVSEAFVKITQPNITFELDNKKPDFKQISTIFFRLRQSKEVANVPLWIIILSVLLGIVLTTILTVLLVKFGFFNRKTKDDLDALQSTEKVNHKTEGIEKF